MLELNTKLITLIILVDNQLDMFLFL